MNMPSVVFDRAIHSRAARTSACVLWRAGDGSAGEVVRAVPGVETQLHPGQRSAQAEVHAGAEGEVRVGVAADVEEVGVGEDGRVAVGGAEQRGDLLRRGSTVTPPSSTSAVAVRSNSWSGES